MGARGAQRDRSSYSPRARPLAARPDRASHPPASRANRGVRSHRCWVPRRAQAGLGQRGRPRDARGRV